eukprot:3045409-Pleurochrysis_carterae.AAC.2
MRLSGVSLTPVHQRCEPSEVVGAQSAHQPPRARWRALRAHALECERERAARLLRRYVALGLPRS